MSDRSKPSPGGIIPNEWTVAKLSDHASLQGGFAFSSNLFQDDGVMLLRISNITNQGITQNDAVYLADRISREQLAFHGSVGDIVIAMSGATTGKNARVSKHDIPLLINQRVGRFVINDRESLDSDYLFHLVNSIQFQDEIVIDAIGGAQPNVSSENVERISVLLPPLPVQRKIASILTTVDNLIEKTEALIEKQKSIKQGMMHDLFTRGVDAGGKLRPPYEEASHLYKESKLGWIPKEWEVEHLVNRISLPQGQVDPKTLPYRDWVLVAPDHIEQRTGRLIAEETASQQNAISGKYLFGGGDVVYSKIRPYLRKAILATHEGICSADMYPLHPCSTLRPRYLLAVILGEEFSRFAESVSERSGFPKLNRSELAEFQTAFPTLPEQDRICHILITADKTLGTVESTLEVFRSLKTGLMQDLLTGKVRVKVDEAKEESPNE